MKKAACAESAEWTIAAESWIEREYLDGTGRMKDGYLVALARVDASCARSRRTGRRWDSSARMGTDGAAEGQVVPFVAGTRPAEMGGGTSQ